MAAVENSEEIQLFDAFVGVDIDRAVGAHLDVRDEDFLADPEDDRQQRGSVHPGNETRGHDRAIADRKWWRFVYGGEHEERELGS